MNIEEKMYTLGQTALFEPLSQAELRYIAENALEVKYPSDKIIFFEGDEGDGLYVVLSGKVLIYKNNDEVLAETGTPGGFFGELALIDNAPRAASVRTLENCEFLFVDRDTFLKVLHKLPMLQRAALDVVMRYLRNER